MKKLYMIGGTMGVGKTATCQILKRKLDTVKIGISSLSPEQAAEMVIGL
ncbi:hypothetical protein [Blautia producta]